jgi:propanol-preferring alcohol dehydrogenase
VSNTTRQDAVELLDMAPKIPLKTEIEVFEFSELPLALQILKQGKIRASAVLRVG